MVVAERPSPAPPRSTVLVVHPFDRPTAAVTSAPSAYATTGSPASFTAMAVRHPSQPGAPSTVSVVQPPAPVVATSTEAITEVEV